MYPNVYEVPINVQFFGQIAFRFNTSQVCAIKNSVSFSRRTRAIIFNVEQQWDPYVSRRAFGEKERLERARGPIIEGA